MGDVMMMIDGKWVAVGHTDGVDFVQEDEALDTETTVVRSWDGKTHFTWTNPEYMGVDEIVDEKTGGHMAKKVSAHADPKFTDGVWVCSVCESESMDKQMFEEAGEWEECAKNHARVATGEEKDALGRYVAGAEAKQNLDRATEAIKQFRNGMQKLGLAAADLNMVMDVMAGDFKTVTPEDVNRLTKKFPELKPALSEVKFPKAVMEELKPLNQREWHKNLMRELNAYYSWGYGQHTFMDSVLDVMDDAWDFIWHDVLRRKY
jgi:hypothetical protein